MRRLICFMALALVLAGCAGNAATPAAEAPTEAVVAEDEAVVGAPVGAATEAAAEAPAEPTEAPATEMTQAPAADVTEAPGDETAPAAGDATAAAAETEAAGGAAPAQAAVTTEATAVAGAPTVAPTAAPASPGQTLAAVQERGQLVCGVHGTFPGFGSVDEEGNFVGFDVDFCKAVAAAVLGDANAVEYRPLSSQERFTAVQTGEVDMLSRNSTWTTSRDTSVGMDFAPVTFYDGQGMMVRAEDNIASLEDMAGASICVQAGTTTELNLADNFRALGVDFNAVVFEDNDQTTAAYDEGRCDGITTDKSQLVSNRLKLQNPEDHVILDVTMSKEPLAPAVLQGDTQWKDIVTWVVFGTFTAEELGITSENVDTFADSEDPNVRRLLGAEGDLGIGLGLENDFMVNVIKAVGNYGEIYNRHLGPETPFDLERGQNALWTEGGLIYAPPFR